MKPHYLVFRSSFGGLPIGEKNEFALSLSEDDTEIYFNRDGGGYELVLPKKCGNGRMGKTVTGFFPIDLRGEQSRNSYRHKK